MTPGQQNKASAPPGRLDTAPMVVSDADDRNAIAEGAENAVCTCMAVQQGEHVLVFMDAASREFGEAVAAAARHVGASSEMLVLEQECSRLEADLVQGLKEHTPDVSFFVARDPIGNTALMPSVLQALSERPTRHANMPGAERRCFVEGMTADYERVAATTLDLRERLHDAHEFVVTHPNGTHLSVACGSPRRWCALTGLYREPNDWGRLPQGEVFTTPLSMDGVLLAHTVGYPLNDRFGLISDLVTLHLADGRATAVECRDSAVTEAVISHLDLDENGRRVGEFALGSNTYLTSSPPSGVLLFDENIPGVHVALGHPFPEETGADWVADIHLDFVLAGASVSVDGDCLIDNGSYVADIGRS